MENESQKLQSQITKLEYEGTTNDNVKQMQNQSVIAIDKLHDRITEIENSLTNKIIEVSKSKQTVVVNSG